MPLQPFSSAALQSLNGHQISTSGGLTPDWSRESVSLPVWESFVRLTQALVGAITGFKIVSVNNLQFLCWLLYLILFFSVPSKAQDRLPRAVKNFQNIIFPTVTL